MFGQIKFKSHTEKGTQRTEVVWMNYEIGQMEHFN